MARRRPLEVWLGTLLIGLAAGAAMAQPAGPGAEAKAPGRHALEFDGEASFVWARQPIPDGLPQGTVELWFRLDRAWDDGPQMPLFGDDAGRMNLVLRDGRLAFNKTLDDAQAELALRPARLGAGWHHVAGVWGPGGMKLFLDGKLVDSRPEDRSPYQRAKTPYDSVPIETRLGLASTWWSDRRYHRFAGGLGFVRISEQRLYEQDFTPRIEAPAESKADVLRYDFAEGRGRVLGDSSGRGHDGLIAGCTWCALDAPPRVAGDSPRAATPAAGTPVIVVPFGCHPDMLADPDELQGFHLTASWTLNVLGGLPVATEDWTLELAPAAGFPHRARLDDGALTGLLKAGAAAAVAYGYLEPAEGKEPENRSAPARLTLRVLRPGQPAWEQTIGLESQTAAAYGEAQRTAARMLHELLVPADRRAVLRGLADDEVADRVRQLWRRGADRLLEQDTFALLRAAADAAEAVRLEPRRAEGWRLLARAHAWLGASPSRSYTSLGRAALARARAAHNIALLLDGPTPETELTGALIARVLPDYLGARAAAVRLAGAEHSWSPEQRAILALAAGEERRLPEEAGGEGPFGPLVRGRIRLINAKRSPARESFEEAWGRNRLATAAPGLVAEAAASGGVVTLRRIAPEALGPGLVQSGRILAWQAVAATGQARPVVDFLRRAAEVLGRPAPGLADDEAQSGFDVLLRLLVRSLGVPAEAHAVLTRLIETCGYDTATAHEVERRLGDCPRIDEVLRQHMDREGLRRIGPDNQLRLAAREVFRRDLLPPDQERALASALVRLNPTRTWVSQQAAVFALAHGPGSRPEFLELVRHLNLAGEDVEAFRAAADSWADWYVMGPFPDSRLDGIRRPFLDESRPVDVEGVIRSEGREVRWKRPLPGQTWGGLSLAAELGAPPEAAVFYAYREILAKQSTTQPLVLFGPQSVRVFLNGRELAFWIHTADLSDRLEWDLPLEPGTNRLLLKLRHPSGPSQSMWCQFPPSAAAGPGGEVRRFVGHQGPVKALAFAPDGRRFVSGSGWPDGDKTVRLWDAETGAELRRFQGHTGQIKSVVFAPDGLRVLSGSQDQTLRLWDVESGRELRRFAGRGEEGVSFSPDGRRALSCSQDGTIRLWDVEGGGVLRQIVGHGGGPVYAIAFAPDGRRALSGGNDRVLRLWDLESGEELRRFEGRTNLVGCVAFTPDGRRAVSGSPDRTVRLWDVETGRELLCSRGHSAAIYSVAFTPDGRRILSGGGDKAVRLWDAATGRELHRFDGHAEIVWSVAVSPDGRSALSGGGGEMRDGNRWLSGQDWAIRLWALPRADATGPDAASRPKGREADGPG